MMRFRDVRRMIQRLSGIFRAKACGILPGIYIKPNVQIGPNKYFILNGGRLIIEEMVRIRDSFRCVLDGGDILISKGTFFNSGVSLNARVGITIGQRCHIGPNVLFFDHDHRFGKDVIISESGFTDERIYVGDNVWIGANVLVLKGVRIGNNCVIAAGITVRKSVPAAHILSASGLKPLT